MIVSVYQDNVTNNICMMPISWTNPVADYDKCIFQFDIKRKNNHNLSAIEAALHNITYICNNYPEPYNLCVSGGVDSQAMIYAWHISKKPFNLYSAIYDHNLNEHDLETLDIFTKQYNIKVNYINFPLFDFLENELEIYVKKYFCGSPHITAYMKISDTIKGGTTLFSGNFLYKDIHRHFMPKNLFGLFHYAVLSNRPCVPYFLCETEEIAHSFKKPNLEELNLEGKTNGYEVKVQYYQQNGFPVIPQIQYERVPGALLSSIGLTGFEKVKEYFDDNCPRPIGIIDRITRVQGQNSNRNFDLLYRNKYESIFNDNKYMIYA